MPNLSILASMLVGAVFYCTLYILIHEFIHYFAARLLGYNARARLSSDSLLPSPSIAVEGEVKFADRLVILYSPYIFNIVLLFISTNLFAKLLALYTLPSILLEEEDYRARLLPYALALQAILVWLSVMFL